MPCCLPCKEKRVYTIICNEKGVFNRKKKIDHGTVISRSISRDKHCNKSIKPCTSVQGLY